MRAADPVLCLTLIILDSIDVLDKLVYVDLKPVVHPLSALAHGVVLEHFAQLTRMGLRTAFRIFQIVYRWRKWLFLNNGLIFIRKVFLNLRDYFLTNQFFLFVGERLSSFLFDHGFCMVLGPLSSFDFTHIFGHL